MEIPEGISTIFLPNTEFTYRISVMVDEQKLCQDRGRLQQQDLLVNVTFADS